MNEIDKKMEENKKLVYSVYSKKIEKLNYLFSYREDIMDVGYFGLWKAIKTFDKDKKISFSTYAYKCIYNEMLMFIRKIKKEDKCIISMDAEVKSNDGKIKVEDTLMDKKDYEEITSNNILICSILHCDKICERDKKLILYFMKGYTQEEIGKFLNISRTGVNRIIKRMKYKLPNYYNSYKGKNE